MRRLRGDEGDAEFAKCATELCGLAFSGKFFFERPMVIVAHEDATVIAVEGGGHAEAVEQALQQVKITFGGFRRKELCGQDFAGSVVLHAQSGELRAASFQPVVRTAVELYQFADLRGTQAALAMRGSTALSRRAQTLLAQ